MSVAPPISQLFTQIELLAQQKSLIDRVARNNAKQCDTRMTELDCLPLHNDQHKFIQLVTMMTVARGWANL